MTSRIIPMLRVSMASGSDPDVIEIEDCSQVYGDGLPFDINDITHDCPGNDTGHVYRNVGGVDICIHCGEEFEP